jgi:hypothetical protein
LSAPLPSGVDTIMAQGAVSSLSEPDVTTWLFANNQGSPTDMVDSSGTLVNHIVYSAFGQDVYESDPAAVHFQGYAGRFGRTGWSSSLMTPKSAQETPNGPRQQSSTPSRRTPTCWTSGRPSQSGGPPAKEQGQCFVVAEIDAR